MESMQGRRRRIAILRDTKEDCRSKVEPDFIKWYNDPMVRWSEVESKEITIGEYDELIQKESLSDLIEYNKTKHTHKIKPTNNTIEFTGADDENSVIGLNPDIFWVNEPYLFDKNVYDEIEQRTNEYTIIDWNPRFNHWIDELKLRKDCIVLHSDFRKNPFLKKKVKDGLLSRQPLSNEFIDVDMDLKPLLHIREEQQVKESVNHLEQALQREIVRCWNNEREHTANKYRWQVYGLGVKAEKEGKIYHNWQPIGKDFFDSINFPEYYGLDLGLVAPTACIAVKIVEKSIFLHEHLYIPGEQIESISWALEKSGVDKQRPIICDRRVRGTGQRDTVSVVDLHGAGFSNAMPAIKGKGSSISGIEFIQKCKVFVTRESKNVWAEYDEYEYAKYNGEYIDEPLKRNDHALDAIKYAINFMRVELNITI